MRMEIVPLQPSHATAAARLFAHRFAKQQGTVAALPGALADASKVEGKLRGLASTGNAIAAVRGDELLGYLGWFTVPRFRGTAQQAAYCSEWTHASVEADQAAIYRRMYAHAAVRWQDASCGAQCITTLGVDGWLRELLFWNGFGLAVVDAVRFIDEPLGAPTNSVVYRSATVGDAAAIRSLDEQLVQHLHAPTVCMPLHPPRNEAKQAEFLQQARNAVWLAQHGSDVIGMLRLAGECRGGCEIVHSADTVGICGAYVQKDYRGQGISASLLHHAMRAYRDMGYTRCSVDWESYNPTATGFWMRHFAPVCYSLIRHVERAL